jgi:hypothetical protein
MGANRPGAPLLPFPFHHPGSTELPTLRKGKKAELTGP